MAKININEIMDSLQEAVEISKGNVSAKRVTLTIQPAARITPLQIKNLRHKLSFSQKAFAAIIGVSTKTVEAWEGGKNEPSPVARRLMSLLDTEPELIQKHHLIR